MIFCGVCGVGVGVGVGGRCGISSRMIRVGFVGDGVLRLDLLGLVRWRRMDGVLFLLWFVL